MKTFLALLGLALGFIGVMMVIQGAVGAVLMIVGAIFFSVALLGSWLETAEETAAKRLAPIEKLLTEIRDRLPAPPSEKDD